MSCLNSQSLFKAIIVPHGFEPNYTLGFIKGLAVHGVKFIVISSDTDQQRISQLGIPNINLRGSQTRERSVIKKAITLLRYYVTLIRYLLKNRKKIIHFTGIFRNALVLLEGWPLCWFFHVCSVRFIYTVHNVLPHGKEKSTFYQWLYKGIYRFPDIFLVHTRLAKNQLIEQFCVPESKIIVISIGLNEEIPISSLTKEEARKRFSFGDSDKIILFFGKADEYKGLDLLIQTFDRLEINGLKLLIASWFPNKRYRQKIQRILSASPKKKDIVLVEKFVPNEEIEIFLKSADVLALPYRHLYQSGLIFLCFGFGLPIVATNVGSVHEFITGEMGIISQTIDVQGLSQSFILFFTHQDKYKSEVIRQQAQKYRWEEICRSLVALYE